MEKQKLRVAIYYRMGRPEESDNGMDQKMLKALKRAAKRQADAILSTGKPKRKYFAG